MAIECVRCLMTDDIRKPDVVEKDKNGRDIPKWYCPGPCKRLLPLDAFGLRKRDDIYPGENVRHKQSWCAECREGSWNN